MAIVISSRGGTHTIEFRRNDRDRTPPSRVLTPVLMGDPRPDREAVSARLLAEVEKRDRRHKHGTLIVDQSEALP